jgi:hypothetical protein
MSVNISVTVPVGSAVSVTAASVRTAIAMTSP